ncbi:MAG TPA: alpha/beta hydrolase-fold protein [Thermoanaerobaculia bacterium]|nr:alpha/beta hydrolase-fold protein [Thermoanaerobaculia bacterium]
MTRPTLAATALLAAFSCLGAHASASGLEERLLVPALPEAVRVVVMTPPSYRSDPARRFPVLYFLHDGRGDENVFFGQGLADALEKDMREGRLPEMLVVVPRGVGTWFVDAPGGGSHYATFLNRTLVPYVDARYRTVASRGARLVAGISMGGYGALRWAFAEPDLFCAAGGLSPAVEQMCWPAVQAMPFFIRPSLERAFGIDPVKNVLRQNDLYAMLLDDPLLAARVPFLHVRCGTEDKYRLGEIVSFLDRYLDAFAIPHSVVLETGVHDWPYWRRVFPEFVRTLSTRLTPPGVP